MKNVSLKGLLSIKKETITKLSDKQMGKLKGGAALAEGTKSKANGNCTLISSCCHS